MKYIMFLFAAALVVMLPIRLYQLFALTEFETGFFTSSHITVTIIYALAIIIPLAFMLLSFISRELPSPMLPVGKNYVLGISSLVFAAALFYDGIKNLLDIFPSITSSVQIVLSVAATNIEESGGYALVFRILFAFLSFIWFAVFAVSNLGGNASYKNYKLLALAPVCWATARLIVYLTSPVGFAKVAELVFELYMLLFFMLFFLTSARISTGVFTVDSMWGIYGYGFSAALFAALVTIPKIVLVAVGKNTVNGFEFEPSDLGAFIFIICYIFASFGIGFDDASKKRYLVSEVVLPDDGVVVRKGVNRKAEPENEAAPEENSVPEQHGIFKVEDEIIENKPEEGELEQSGGLMHEEEPEGLSNEISITENNTEENAESSEEDDFGDSLITAIEKSEEVHEEKHEEKSEEVPEEVPEMTPEYETDGKTDEEADEEADEDFDESFGLELSDELSVTEETQEGASASPSFESYDELLKGFEENENSASDFEKEKDYEKSENTTDETEKTMPQEENGASADFSAEGFFAESGEDESESEDGVFGRKKGSPRAKKSSRRSAARLKEAAENADMYEIAPGESTEALKNEAESEAFFEEPSKKDKKAERKREKKEKKRKAEKAKKHEEPEDSEEPELFEGEAAFEPDGAIEKHSDFELHEDEDLKPEKKKRNTKKSREKKSGGLFGKKSEESNEEEIISTVTLKDMKKGNKE